MKSVFIKSNQIKLYVFKLQDMFTYMRMLSFWDNRFFKIRFVSAGLEFLDILYTYLKNNNNDDNNFGQIAFFQ